MAGNLVGPAGVAERHPRGRRTTARDLYRFGRRPHDRLWSSSHDNVAVRSA